MPMQLVPRSITTWLAAASGTRLEVQPLSGEGQPAREHVEVRFGAGFRNTGQLADALRRVASQLEGGTFRDDMEVDEG